MKSLEVVVGGQFGSEAKGHVVQRLTERALHDGPGRIHVVRVAGPNAGHTGYDLLNRKWALRQIPVAAVVGSPRVTLHIAAGSEIDPPVLLDEFDRLTDAGLRPELVISRAATIVQDKHKESEAREGLNPDTGRSTGKGIGAARAGRIMRRAKTVQDDFAFQRELGDRHIYIATHEQTVAGFAYADDKVIIEGTQGFGLGVHTSYYPETTSSDCRAADFMAMAGVHAWEFDDIQVWVVARVYPIRIAGASGPLKDETTWLDLGLQEEYTTVTQRVRRVGGEDWDLVRRAVTANGGGPEPWDGTVRLALTMLDQKFPQMANRHAQFWDNDMQAYPGEWKDVYNYVHEVEEATGAPIRLVTTGPNTGTFI